MPEFEAEILSAGRGGHAIVVPKPVAAGFPSRRPLVNALINGTMYQSRLMVYGGTCYVGLRKDLLRQLAVAAGDVVHVELSEAAEPAPAVDPAPTDLEPPAELTAALAADPAAAAAYAALPAAHRHEYDRWISGADEPAKRAERIARTLRRLADHDR